VLAHERAQDPRVGRQLLGRARGHDAARRRQADRELDARWAAQAPAEQRVLHEGLAGAAIVEHEVGAEPPDVPVGVRHDPAQARQRARGDQMDRRDVVVRARLAEPARRRAARALEPDGPLEQLRQRLGDLLAYEHLAGQRHAQLAALTQLGTTGAQPRIGRPALVGDPLTGALIDHDPAPVAGAAAEPDLDGVEQLAEHRLDRIAPEREDSHVDDNRGCE
jgi:hypothetical protein